MHGNLGKKLLKKAGKFAGKKLITLLAPLMPMLIMVAIGFFCLAILVASIYGSMAPQRALTGVNASPDDQKIYQHYNKLCNEYNVNDTWLVSSEPAKPGESGKYESSKGTPYYPGQGAEYIGEMVDRYRNDYKLRLQWNMVHSVGLYWAFTQGKDQIPPEMREQFTNELHPYFYYKKSQVISSSEKDTSTSEVYLLVEAYTISGHYQYHYQWVTDQYGKTSVTYEQLKDTQQILPNRWQRLDDFMKKSYKLKKNDDVELNRTYVLQASDGFDQQKEWLEWLVNNLGYSGFVSSAMIPPELIPYFQEAQDKYGVPWWFLAAVSFKESSFNPQAENSSSHCYGLMQLTPSNWLAYSVQLGFDPVIDHENPRAQILCGAYMLSSGFKGIDWKSNNWKEETLSTLISYGGFAGPRAKERCREEYAKPIWQLAEGFKGAGTWPTPGYMTVTSPYGMRYHPIKKKWAYHSGIDIGAPSGATIVSVSAGTVVQVGYDGGGYGNFVVIRDAVHQYLYGHMRERAIVHEGGTVQAGQAIGHVGQTGLATGPHLHFEVVDLQTHNRIDPLLVLQQ